jgi:hypothetical protein
MTDTRKLAYGTYHIDASNYDAAWGARLIYAEVMAGGTGVVWDRTDMTGSQADKDKLLAVLNGGAMKLAMDRLRKDAEVGLMDSRTEEAFVPYNDGNHDGRVMIVASPQRSYGYLYVTAVLKNKEEEV